MTKYFSQSRNEYIDVETMADQHVRNAFLKMLREDKKSKITTKDVLRDVARKIDEPILEIK
tara:strand:+ start:894 stop:1076 length:183 start_codon:yes stop_codon:yes gene_type:complete